MVKQALHTDDEISNVMLLLSKMREECADDSEYTKEKKHKAIDWALYGLGDIPVTD